MNGWKRIGIVISVAWFLGAGFYAYNSEIDRASHFIASNHVQCDSDLTVYKDSNARDAGFQRCNERADDALTLAISRARFDGAIAGTVPVILGWPIVYLLLFLVRWLKRGFVQQPSRSS
jgi:hypothetical protein